MIVYTKNFTEFTDLIRHLRIKYGENQPFTNHFIGCTYTLLKDDRFQVLTAWDYNAFYQYKGGPTIEFQDWLLLENLSGA